MQLGHARPIGEHSRNAIPNRVVDRASATCQHPVGKVIVVRRKTFLLFGLRNQIQLAHTDRADKPSHESWPHVSTFQSLGSCRSLPDPIHHRSRHKSNRDKIRSFALPWALKFAISGLNETRRRPPLAYADGHSVE